MEIPLPQMPAPQQLPFQPVPTQVNALTASNGGREYVLLVFTTPQGTNAFFFEPAQLAALIKRLESLGVQARSGLVVPAAV